ncbi:hypothetical protein E4U15_008161, partial [Claviceps sp. LM218 group G6]
MATLRQLSTSWQLLYDNCHSYFDIQFNSYSSTAIYKLAATLRKLPFLLRVRIFPPSTTHSIPHLNLST